MRQMPHDLFDLACQVPVAHARKDAAEVERLQAILRERGWNVRVLLEHDGRWKTYAYPADPDDEEARR